jgi:hypothetical protein
MVIRFFIDLFNFWYHYFVLACNLHYFVLACNLAEISICGLATGDVTRAHFLYALFVRVIVQWPNISSYRP